MIADTLATMREDKPRNRPSWLPGRRQALVIAAAAACSAAERKLAEAVDLEKLHCPGDVDESLRVATESGRVGAGDLAAILSHRGARVSGWVRG